MTSDHSADLSEGRASEATTEGKDLQTLLKTFAPFDSLGRELLESVANAASIQHFAPRQLILDAFRETPAGIYLVLSGRVDLWHNSERIYEPADQTLEQGGVFGYSAMLAGRSLGPRAQAATAATIARLPDAVAAPVFTSRRGARFLAEQAAESARRRSETPSFSTVDELIVTPPLIVPPATSAHDTARLMTERASSYAAVRRGEGFGLVTDALLRRRILAEQRPASGPIGEIAEETIAVRLGDSAAEASIRMLEQDVDFVLVTDRSGDLRGVLTSRDFMMSPVTTGAALHQQLRQAATLYELTERARRVPRTLADLLAHGLGSSQVVAVYSTLIDSIVRRAISLVFERHPELTVDAFTWLSLGSNGRREATLSSDVDSAVAFDNAVGPAEIARYRAAFVDVGTALAQAGLSTDPHGATVGNAAFTRTNAEWHAAGLRWLAAPEDNQGAIMTSLLVDGRAIHGDPGLPEVAAVFGDLRRHPGTMRLLLKESLASRAKPRSARRVLGRRSGVFDIKASAILPIVNLARWAGLSVGTTALGTVERLGAAAGSAILPHKQASSLIDVFEALQRLRLRYQIAQLSSGAAPSNRLKMKRLSPIDGSILAQAVREIAAVQRRMDNVALYVPPESWVLPESQ